MGPIIFNRTIEIFTELNTFVWLLNWCEAFSLFHGKLTWIDIVSFLWDLICVAYIIGLILFATFTPWFKWINWFSEETLLTVHSEKWFWHILWRILLLALCICWLCFAVFRDITWDNFLSILWDLILVACVILNPNHTVFGPWCCCSEISHVYPEVANLRFILNWEHGFWIDFDILSVDAFQRCFKWIWFKIFNWVCFCFHPLSDVLAVIIIWQSSVMFNELTVVLMISANSCNQYNHHNINVFKHFFLFNFKN